jgi:Fe2+ or Zn2+ uptake regulation protein
MTSSEDVALPAALRDAGLRVTASRLAVLAAVAEGAHLTADQVVSAVRGASARFQFRRRTTYSPR